MKQDIDQKKLAALSKAGGDRKKMDFDLKRDCYKEGVHSFVFDLEVQRNLKGEFIKVEEKT